MDALQLVEALSEWEELPVDAIRAAQANRETMAPVFLRSIEEFLSLDGEPVSPAALFLMFHLLGEWREKSAYRPLAYLLRLPLGVSTTTLKSCLSSSSRGESREGSASERWRFLGMGLRNSAV